MASRIVVQRVVAVGHDNLLRDAVIVSHEVRDRRRRLTRHVIDVRKIRILWRMRKFLSQMGIGTARSLPLPLLWAIAREMVFAASIVACHALSTFTQGILFATLTFA